MVPLQIQASSWYYLTFILNSRFWLAEQTIKKCMLFEHDTMRFKLFSSWDSRLTWKDSDFLWTRDSGLRMLADFNRLSFELPNFLDWGGKGKIFLNSCKNVRTLLKNIKIFFSILLNLKHLAILSKFYSFWRTWLVFHMALTIFFATEIVLHWFEQSLAHSSFFLHILANFCTPD